MTLYFEEEGAVTLPLDCEKTGRVAVETALDILGCPYEAEVSLLLTTNEEIHRMNLEFRDVDRPTDVLSFPMIDFAVPGRAGRLLRSGNRRVVPGRYRNLKREGTLSGRSLRTFRFKRICFFNCPFCATLNRI